MIIQSERRENESLINRCRSYVYYLEKSIEEKGYELIGKLDYMNNGILIHLIKLIKILI